MDKIANEIVLKKKLNLTRQKIVAEIAEELRPQHPCHMKLSTYESVLMKINLVSSTWQR